jgi:hypothetical protein
MSVLAIHYPPANGQPGDVEFGPGLSTSEKKQIVDDWEWFERGDARRARRKDKRK